MRTGFQKLIKQAVILSLLGFLVGQGSGYLAQKLMVENNIRQRVQDALSKIVDNNKYVINVDVDLEISDEVEEQITMLAPREKKEPPPPPPSSPSQNGSGVSQEKPIKSSPSFAFASKLEGGHIGPASGAAHASGVG